MHLNEQFPSFRDRNVQNAAGCTAQSPANAGKGAEKPFASATVFPSSASQSLLFGKTVPQQEKRGPFPNRHPAGDAPPPKHATQRNPRSRSHPSSMPLDAEKTEEDGFDLLSLIGGGDNERSLILLLMFILIKEKADTYLLLAMLYLVI